MSYILFPLHLIAESLSCRGYIVGEEENHVRTIANPLPGICFLVFDLCLQSS